MPSATIRERLFTPCPEHEPAPPISEALRVTLARSSLRDCIECQRRTRDMVYSYALQQAGKAPAKRPATSYPWQWELRRRLHQQRRGFAPPPDHPSWAAWWNSRLAQWKEAAHAN